MMSTGEHVRGTFEHDGLRLSYLDSGGAAPVLLALHGHLNEARFVDTGALPDYAGYRVIALDQRGYGESDHASGYELDDYAADALALLDHLEVPTAVVLGHSLGAAVAYTLAARAPDRVRALVIVDMAADITGDLSITRSWPTRAPSRDALVEAFGFMGANQAYVMREYPDGWGVPWSADDMVTSQFAIDGDHWDDWLATSMPTLLIHGTRSQTLSTEQAEEMAARRPNTELHHLEAGHAVYIDAREQYAQVVGEFLSKLPGGGGK
jgi:esterase